MAAEHHSSTLLNRLACPHAVGSSASQDCPRVSLGTIQYILKKLAAINTPEILNVQSLCRESVTSHGSAESADATVAPNPSRTRTEGNAQHNSVLSDVNREK